MNLTFLIMTFARVFRYLLSVVVECPDLLLMFSLFVIDKEFLHCVLDIASVFAGKLVIDG